MRRIADGVSVDLDGDLGPFVPVPTEIPDLEEVLGVGVAIAVFRAGSFGEGDSFNIFVGEIVVIYALVLQRLHNPGNRPARALDLSKFRAVSIPCDPRGFPGNHPRHQNLYVFRRAFLFFFFLLLPLDHTGSIDQKSKFVKAPVKV